MTLQTSRKQVPASAKLLPNLAPNWAYANHVLNFGCGKFPELTQEHLLNRHMQVMSVTNYDPNYIKDSNKATEADAKVLTELYDVRQQRYCVAICANVLNVCKDLDAVLSDLAQVDFDCCVIQIYEGNRTAKGRKTRDGYQRNAPVADYMEAILQHFHRFDVTLHRAAKCITITKGRKFYCLDDTED